MSSSSSSRPNTNSSNNTTTTNSSSSFPQHLESQVIDQLIRVTNFLKQAKPGESFSSEEIQQQIGIHILQNINEEQNDDNMIELELYNRIANNPHIKIFDGRFQYDHELSTVTNLLSYIESKPTGVRREALLEFDSHGLRGWARECNELLLRGKVLAVKHTSEKKVVMYPRGQRDLWVKLNNTKVTGTIGSSELQISRDVRKLIRRGDLIRINGKNYRVSLEFAGEAQAVTTTTTTSSSNSNSSNNNDNAQTTTIINSEWLEFCEAPYSTSSIKDPHKGKKGDARIYSKDFTEKSIPIAPPLESSVQDVPVFKHGCTNDIRSYWHKISNEKGNIKTGRDLDRALIDARLLSQEKIAEYNHASIERQERRDNEQQQQQQQQNPHHKRRKTNNNRPYMMKSNLHMMNSGGE
jgi:hypothetical protein